MHDWPPGRCARFPPPRPCRVPARPFPPHLGAQDVLNDSEDLTLTSAFGAALLPELRGFRGTLLGSTEAVALPLPTADLGTFRFPPVLALAGVTGNPRANQLLPGAPPGWPNPISTQAQSGLRVRGLIRFPPDG